MNMSNFTYINNSSHWRSNGRDHFCTADSYFGHRYLPCPKEQR